MLFRKHCLNESEVISSTAAEADFLFSSSSKQEDTGSSSSSFSSKQDTGSCNSFSSSKQDTGSFNSTSSWCGPCGKTQFAPAKYEDPPQKQKFKFDWSIEVDKGWLPDSKGTLKLCRKSFCFLHGISENAMKRVSDKMKSVNSANITSAKSVRSYDHHSYFGDSLTMADISKIFDDNEISSTGVAEARAGLVRASNAQIDAMLWMESYFDHFEHQPNSKHIHLDTTWKRTIWQEYCQAPHTHLGTDQNPLSEGNFKSLWEMLFDSVRIRKVKRVTGKCWTCAYINEIRQKRKGRDIDQACKELMIMHRAGYFMLERIEYRRRVAEAVIYSPDRVMSTIIDGASQNHCTLPHPGQNAQFSKGLEQHIEGELTHGHGLTIYRSFPTVSADSDFTIYCLLQELRKWSEKHKGVYPDTWYIQIDGGSENANQYLLAAMEYLCIKRLCKKIILTR